MQCSDLFHYRRAVLRMFWDDEDAPSVEVPIGDFFGVPFAQPQFFQSMLMSVNPGADRSSTEGLNMYFPMPFSKRARIELFNDCDIDLTNFWYHINYEETPGLEPNLGYFHACWRRENPCEKVDPEHKPEDLYFIHHGINLTGDNNYVILNAKGRGNYVGCILQIDNLRGGWYGEGDDMIFIDGEKWPPSLHGTGTEEIFGGGACPNEAYFNPFCGYLQVEHPRTLGRNAMYRFYANDPVRFKESIRVTIEHGHANNLGEDYTSVAFWYQEEPHAPLDPLPPAEERFPRVPESCHKALKSYREGLKRSAELLKVGRMPEELHRDFEQFSMACKKAFAAADYDGFVEKTKLFLQECTSREEQFPE
jgi:hypothetical protein